MLISATVSWKVFCIPRISLPKNIFKNGLTINGPKNSTAYDTNAQILLKKDILDLNYWITLPEVSYNVIKF